MGFQFNNNGVWTTPKQIQVNIGGAWTPTKQVWVNDAGTWKLAYQGVPSNMIVLYANSSNIPAGSTLLSSAYGRFPMGSTSYGLIGGSSTHNASQHGAANGNTSTYSHPNCYAVNIDGDNTSYTTIASHYHTFNHTHSATDNVSHIPPYYDLIPTIGSTTINSGAIFFSDTSLSGILTAYTALYNYFLRLNSTGATTGGVSTHQHAGFSGSSGATSITFGGRNSVLHTYNVGPSHSHTINHTHSAQANNPVHTVLASYSTNTAIASISQLPIGTIAFFSDSNLPQGWDRYTLCDNRLIKCSNTSLGSQAGNSSDSIGSETFTSGSSTPNYTYYSSLGTSGYYTVETHPHTFTHGHSTIVDITPPYFTFVIGKKTS